jgi:ubiquinone/menaquinone biosynthesis C-methylase UbiE
MKPTAASRFDGIAEIYAHHSPGYPDAARTVLIRTAGLGPDTLVVDVGCGTGIASRWLAEAGIPVLGLEPNPQMLAQAQAVAPATGPMPRFQLGQADATGLPDTSAACIIAAQSFHWFANENTLREFHRILHPLGWVALLWNERDERDPATAAYGALVRSPPDAATVEAARASSSKILLASPLFEEGRREVFSSAQDLDEEGFLGRARSNSYAPKDPEGVERYLAGLRGVFARFQTDGRIRLVYETSLYLARRPAVEERQ